LFGGIADMWSSSSQNSLLTIAGGPSRCWSVSSSPAAAGKTHRAIYGMVDAMAPCGASS